MGKQEETVEIERKFWGKNEDWKKTTGVYNQNSIKQLYPFPSGLAQQGLYCFLPLFPISRFILIAQIQYRRKYKNSSNSNRKLKNYTIILLRYPQSMNSGPLIYTLDNWNTPKVILITLRKTPRKILLLNSNADHHVSQEMYI